MARVASFAQISVLFPPSCRGRYTHICRILYLCNYVPGGRNCPTQQAFEIASKAAGAGAWWKCSGELVAYTLAHLLCRVSDRDSVSFPAKKERAADFISYCRAKASEEASSHHLEDVDDNTDVCAENDAAEREQDELLDRAGNIGVPLSADGRGRTRVQMSSARSVSHGKRLVSICFAHFLRYPTGTPSSQCAAGERSVFCAHT